LRASSRLLRILEKMQRNQDRKMTTNVDDAIAVADTTATIRYCWVIPHADGDRDRDRDRERDNGLIDSLIKNNGLPLYRPLSRIQNEGTLMGGDGDRDGGNAGGGGGGGGADKKPSLTFEQQARQLQLQSAWKIATQREDAGALGRIRNAMEELEKEIMSMRVGGANVDAGENATLMTIRRAMMSNAQDDDDVVGLMSDLEEATMLRLDSEEDDKL
jgi:hypothetical protein